MQWDPPQPRTQRPDPRQFRRVAEQQAALDNTWFDDFRNAPIAVIADIVVSRGFRAVAGLALALPLMATMYSMQADRLSNATAIDNNPVQPGEQAPVAYQATTDSVDRTTTTFTFSSSTTFERLSGPVVSRQAATTVAESPTPSNPVKSETTSVTNSPTSNPQDGSEEPTTLDPTAITGTAATPAAAATTQATTPSSAKPATIPPTSPPPASPPSSPPPTTPTPTPPATTPQPTPTPTPTVVDQT